MRAAAVTPVALAVLAVLAALALSACAGDDGALRKDELPAALRFEPPADCAGALFERTFAQCPTVEASFPMIWDALAPTLTRDDARAFIDAQRTALDACCHEPALLELDVVVGCDGRVLDTAVRAPLFVDGCVEDAVRSWTFARPKGTERGLHLLVPCGPGA